jgi:hypothetical protein
VNMPYDLALEYFKIANGVTAFYVVQTLVFLNTIYKEPKLLTALCNSRREAHFGIWAFASTYIIVVLGCGSIEYNLYNVPNSGMAQFSPVLGSCLWAAIGRTFVIAFLAFGCSSLVNVLRVETVISQPNSPRV